MSEYCCYVHIVLVTRRACRAPEAYILQVLGAHFGKHDTFNILSTTLQFYNLSTISLPSF